MAFGNVADASAETIVSQTEELKVKGYFPMVSGLQPGDYSGTVDNVIDFISRATYDKPNGAVKGGIMYAVRAEIKLNDSESFKTTGFEVVGGKRLLLTFEQVKVLSSGCSFSFTISDKGYSGKVLVILADDLTAESINLLDMVGLIELATNNGLSIKGLTVPNARLKLISDLIPV